ncbi:MAG: MFS transporter [Deltaproteobacteria bacterium]|nr:MFS transporter [Deltaproteobacteria bacterium]
MPQYQTAPVPSRGWPGGIPFIIGNELAERFSFYGMKTILVVFMTRYLLDAGGGPGAMAEADATAWYHTFVSAVYFTPLLGALLADIFLGKYKTIVGLSIVYCLGHLALALDQTRLGLSVGLALIALGAGGIKPCVSAHLGDQFGQSNMFRLKDVFGYFYFSINLGAFVSMLLTPVLLDRYGPHAAFGLPGALMLVATWTFWLGRHRFVHIPPGGRRFTSQLLSREGLSALARLTVIYLFVAMFWALFDQTGSAWVLQAEHMNRRFLGIDWLPSQIQAMNPLLVMLYVPLFNFVIYPAIDRVFPLSPLRKIGIGFFIAAGAFLITALAESMIQAGGQPSIGWQLVAYLIITASEIFVSITCLEFSYTQAPTYLKSFVMAFFMMSVSVGNLFTAGVNFLIRDEQGNSLLTGPEYYLFFAGAMFVTAVVFVPIAGNFKEQTHIHEEGNEAGTATSAP